VANFHFASVTPTLLSHRRESPLGQFWSLAVEEQFYLLYPAVFAAVVVVGRRWGFRRCLAIGLGAIVIVSFAVSVATSKRGHLVAFYSFDSRAWELAVGALLALGTTQFKRIPPVAAALITWVGVVGVLFSAFDLTQSLAYPGFYAALPVLSTALVIAGGTSVPAWGAEFALRRRPFQALGHLSYGWYLWHWPILVIAAERVHTGVLRQPLAKNLVLALVALGIAAVTYRFVENPIRHSRWLADNPRLTVVFSLALIVSCVLLTLAF
jgi:peptidoglycan/LPS O-acetylase OafA/YrhL